MLHLADTSLVKGYIMYMQVRMNVSIKYMMGLKFNIVGSIESSGSNVEGRRTTKRGPIVPHPIQCITT